MNREPPATEVDPAAPASLSAASQPVVLAVHAIMERATVLAYQDGFVIAGLITALGIPLCLLVQRTRYGAPARRSPVAAGTPARAAVAKA